MKQIGTLSIGQVADLLGVKTHTIRYWTDNFEHIKVEIGKGDRRYFDQSAIEELKKIKMMMEIYKMSIDGIKKLVSYNKININKINPDKKGNEKNYEKFLLNISEKLKSVSEKLNSICPD